MEELQALIERYRSVLTARVGEEEASRYEVEPIGAAGVRITSPDGALHVYSADSFRNGIASGAVFT